MEIPNPSTQAFLKSRGIDPTTVLEEGFGGMGYWRRGDASLGENLESRMWTYWDDPSDGIDALRAKERDAERTRVTGLR